jgi:3-oxoacyl-[acyl-carrier-protein] synthase II
MSERRVAVTGLGVATPFGLDIGALWESLARGDSAVRAVNLVEPGGPPRHLVTQVPAFDPRQYVPDRKLLRIMTRTDRLGLAAARGATDQAPAGDLPATERAAYLGTRKEWCELEELRDVVRVSREEDGRMTPRKLGSDGYAAISPLALVNGLPNGCLFAVSVLHQIRGANTNFMGTGEAGLSAIGTAYLAAREGRAEWALAGGHDSGIERRTYADFYHLGMISQSVAEPKRAVRPLDRRRDGFALGEGAGMVVLEPLERARARGARIWAEVVGYAATCDGTGLVVPRADGKALVSAISAALADAGIGADEVQYVNAYASATQVGDRTELRALEQVFGAGKRPLVSGLKGALGHLLAAAGAVEFVATALALDRQVVPPTVNLREPDAACHFDCVPGAARAAALRNAVTISRGIGGQNAVMVLRRAEP